MRFRLEVYHQTNAMVNNFEKEICGKEPSKN
jgi:hypothetical protein